MILKIMKGALVILVTLVVVGVILYVVELSYKRRSSSVSMPAEEGGVDGSLDNESGGSDADEQSGGSEEVCCGQHLVCEKDSLSPMDAVIEYYDDEELDRFRGRGAEDYNGEEVEEIRDVLMTLRDEDVAGWARSITKRGIELPTEVRDELLLLVRAHRGIEG